MIDRRSFLIAGTMLAVSPACAAPLAADAGAPEILPIWPSSPPGGGGPSEPPQVSSSGAMRRIAVPTLEVHLPARPSGAAMLVAAGGGYRRIQMGKEARPAAQWLTERGITVFILAYRLPGEGWPQGPLAPLQDAQRALRVIRAQAGRRKLDPNRVGVLGFSSGGHLMGLAATRHAFQSYAPADATDTESARPDAAALIYPIITLEPPHDRTSTRRIMIGEHPSPQESADWSANVHVRAGNPPFFLVHADDDSLAPPQNAALMAEACNRAGVPVELHRLPSGGHGFGMGRAGSPTAAWPGRYAAWLRANKVPA